MRTSPGRRHRSRRVAGEPAPVCEKLRETLGIRLTGGPVQSVEVLADHHARNEQERIGVLRHRVEKGHLSGYGLVNAVTRCSQDVADHDRATELDALGD